jgi:hypothetical protein
MSTARAQHGHAQQAGARARTHRRQTARAQRAHSTGTQACAAPSAPVRGRPDASGARGQASRRTRARPTGRRGPPPPGRRAWRRPPRNAPGPGPLHPRSRRRQARRAGREQRTRPGEPPRLREAHARPRPHTARRRRCRPPCTVCLNVGKARPNPHRHRTRSSQPKYGGRIRAKSQKWRGCRISWRNGGATRGVMGTNFGRAPDGSGPDTGVKSRC